MERRDEVSANAGAECSAASSARPAPTVTARHNPIESPSPRNATAPGERRRSAGCQTGCGSSASGVGAGSSMPGPVRVSRCREGRRHEWFPGSRRGRVAGRPGGGVDEVQDYGAARQGGPLRRGGRPTNHVAHHRTFPPTTAKRPKHAVHGAVTMPWAASGGGIDRPGRVGHRVGRFGFDGGIRVRDRIVRLLDGRRIGILRFLIGPGGPAE